MILKDINEKFYYYILCFMISYNWIDSTRQVWVDISRRFAFSCLTYIIQSVSLHPTCALTALNVANRAIKHSTPFLSEYHSVLLCRCV